MAGQDRAADCRGLSVVSGLAWRAIAALLALPGLAAADAKSTMDLCRDAAARAADAHGIPRAVMLAITSVEHTRIVFDPPNLLTVNG